jgi:hypothetical protein
MDAECYIKVGGVIMPEFVATTSTLEFYLYDSSGGTIGQQTADLTLLDSQLTAGDVVLDSFTADTDEI